jgi:hypothetical protein
MVVTVSQLAAEANGRTLMVVIDVKMIIAKAIFLVFIFLFQLPVCRSFLKKLFALKLSWLLTILSFRFSDIL